MKHRRKKEQCSNCGLSHPLHYNFCPQCGQENTTSKVSFTGLLSDLFSNYLTFDSRTGRTIVPFIFRPGMLTVAFNQGKRLLYLHPVRLYILMNLFFFFVFGRAMSVENFSLAKLSQGDAQEEVVGNQLVANQKPPISGPEIAGIAAPGQPPADSVRRRLVKKLAATGLGSEQDLANKAAKGSVKLGNTGSPFVRLIQDRSLTPHTLLDSLEKHKITIAGKRGNRGEFALAISAQLLKVGQRDLPLFLLSIIGNIPAMMLLLLPLLAVYLKLLYIRRGQYFIEHFIFSLHIQAFIYLVFGLTLLAWLACDRWGWDYEIETLVASQVVLGVYHLAMFRRVYGQGWVKTVLKTFIFSQAYLLTFIVFMTLELLYSFWTF
jgi:hypothetical protein